jgi:tRNA A37 methylthiotransferase MiaB
MKSFYIFSAGCIRRGLDVIHLQKYLCRNNWKLSRTPKDAALIIVATCGVVHLNEINSLRSIEEAMQRKGDAAAQLVVTGCLPLINPDPIRSLGDVVFIPTGELDRFDELINAEIPFKDIDYPDSISDNKDIVNYLVARSFCRQSRLYKQLFYKHFMNARFLSASIAIKQAYETVKAFLQAKPRVRFQPYYNIKIADGCLSNCAFCATKYATGTLRSRPLVNIIDNFRSGLKNGYKTFQLIAEDTGCYGKDNGSSLAELIDTLCSFDDDFKLIIIDCNPQWLVEDWDALLPVLKRNHEKIREIFVPLQSASNTILQAMHREYRIEDVLKVLAEIRDKAPSIALRTSLLIGFPGETEEDFNASREAAQAVDFAEVTINRYEDRPKALSAGLNNKVDQKTIERRARILAEDGCLILS